MLGGLKHRLLSTLYLQARRKGVRRALWECGVNFTSLKAGLSAVIRKSRFFVGGAVRLARSCSDPQTATAIQRFYDRFPEYSSLALFKIQFLGQLYVHVCVCVCPDLSRLALCVSRMAAVAQLSDDQHLLLRYASPDVAGALEPNGVCCPLLQFATLHFLASPRSNARERSLFDILHLCLLQLHHNRHSLSHGQPQRGDYHFIICVSSRSSSALLIYT
jgi:hypothetical protein